MRLPSSRLYVRSHCASSADLECFTVYELSSAALLSSRSCVSTNFGVLQLMRRKGIADVQLREAGAQAFTQYVCWYCSMQSCIITAPSALDAHALRSMFLVPNANDAVSSMAHSFHTRKRSMSASAMDMTLSTLRDNPSGMMVNQEDEVAPGILENAVSVMETLEKWKQIRSAHTDLECDLKALLESLKDLDAKLRSIPVHAHAVCSMATEEAVSFTLSLFHDCPIVRQPCGQ